jgi:tetratricopeptide (TPR) repeat protein
MKRRSGSCNKPSRWRRAFPPKIHLQRILTALGSTYQALQQWEEAQAALEEAVAVAETLDRGLLRMSALTRLCMSCAEAEEWERAHRYALETIALRKSHDAALIMLDFSRQYETEALLRAGEESLARAEVQRLGEGLGSNRRFRIPYLRSKAVLAAWEGHSEQAIGHLHEAVQLAAELGLPGERWQIQAALGSLYEGRGEPVQARIAFGEAATIIQELAEGIKDEALRARFLAGPQIQPVVQHAQRLANPVPQDHAEQSRL